MRSVEATSEALSYIPWIRMTNSVLWALRNKDVPDAKAYNEEVDLIHIANDPNTLVCEFNNTTSIRKPDTVFVPRAVASMLYGEADWQELAENWSIVPPTKEARKEEKKKKKTKKGRKGKGKGKEKDLPSLDWGDALLCVEYKRKRSIEPQSVNVQQERFYSFENVLVQEHILGVQNKLNQECLSNSKKRKREEKNEDECEDEKRAPKKRKFIFSERLGFSGSWLP